MSSISCCSPTGRIVIAGYLVVGIVADTLGDGEPRAIPTSRRAELSWCDSASESPPYAKSPQGPEGADGGHSFDISCSRSCAFQRPLCIAAVTISRRSEVEA